MQYSAIVNKSSIHHVMRDVKGVDQTGQTVIVGQTEVLVFRVRIPDLSANEHQIVIESPHTLDRMQEGIKAVIGKLQAEQACRSVQAKRDAAMLAALKISAEGGENYELNVEV